MAGVLKTKDMMQRAEDKGISKRAPVPSSGFSHWKEEAILDKRTTEKQTEIREHIREQYGEQIETIKRTEKEPIGNQNRKRNRDPIRKQIEEHLENNSPERLSFKVNCLMGLQQKLFNYIFHICIARNATETGCISTINLSEIIGCSYHTMKETIKRLIKKGVIVRLRGKTARGGYINLGITEEIKTIALEKAKQEEREGRSGLKKINHV